MADNYWSFCNNHEILVHMVNDIIEAVEPGHGLWWTSSYEEEDKLTLRVGRESEGRKERLGLAVEGGLRGVGVSFSA